MVKGNMSKMSLHRMFTLQNDCHAAPLVANAFDVRSADQRQQASVGGVDARATVCGLAALVSVK